MEEEEDVNEEDAKVGGTSRMDGQRTAGREEYVRRIERNTEEEDLKVQEGLPK